MDDCRCACRSGAIAFARTSPPLNSANANRWASSGDAPPATNSRQRSSRCCESSSTISLSRVGESCRDDKRERTSFAQRALSDASSFGVEGPALSDALLAGVEGSGMFISRHSPNGLHERGKCFLLQGKHAAPLSGDVVEAAAPLVGLFDPGALDPSTLLEAIEQGIEGINVECQLATRPRVNQPAQVVAVPGARVEQREDEQFSRSALQLAVEGARI